MPPDIELPPLSANEPYDVVVVGDRAAGAATAMLLARASLRTAVLDIGGRRPADRATAVLTRAGVLLLDRWGLLAPIVAADTPPVRRSTFRYGDAVDSVSLKPSLGIGALYAPGHRLLEELLLGAAAAAGAHLHSPVDVVELVTRGERITGVRARRGDGRFVDVAASLVVGADGIDSTVARCVGAPYVRVGHDPSTVTFAYWPDLGIDTYEWGFLGDARTGVLPTNGGACAFAAASPARIGTGGAAVIREAVAATSADLAARLDAAGQVTDARTWRAPRGFVRQSHGPGWALTGTAGFFKEPTSAHGFTDALRDAELLASAIISGFGRPVALDAALAGYQSTRDRFGVPIFEAVEGIAGRSRTDDELTHLLHQLGSAMADEAEMLAAFADWSGVVNRRTLVGVWAHPDDEAYMSAGLMADFRRRGDRVVIVMATLGERGTDDPVRWPPERLAAVRHTELRNSLAVLDVDDIRILGYPDGGCAAIDGERAVADLLADIEPDVIVTFGPDGMTGHPDHRAVSRWATIARDLIRPEAELWYSTVTPEFHMTWGRVNDDVHFFEDQLDPPCDDADELVHNERLTNDLLDLKMAALEAHMSQTRSFIDRLGCNVYRQWWGVESFRRAGRSAVGAGATHIHPSMQGAHP